MDPFLSDVIWIVVLGFIIAFILAFGVGANDVSNSFATSIASGVLTFRQACYLASVFEVLGAVLLGYKVSDTIRKGILDVEVYEGNELQLMYGMLAALIGSATWLLIATYFKLPVSSTHAVVGATVGFGLVAHGVQGLQYQTLIMIAVSWVVSPVMSGVVSVAIFLIINQFILKAKNPFTAGLFSLPFIYGITIFINILSITWDGSKLLAMDNLPVWLVFTITCACTIIMMICTQLFIVPWQRKKVQNESKLARKIKEDHIFTTENGFTTDKPPLENGFATEKPPLENGFATDVTIARTEINGSVNKSPLENGFSTELNGSTPKDPELTDAGELARMQEMEQSEEEVNSLFRFLQILAAIFASFAHGGNDVSNATGPLIALWFIYAEGSVLQKSESPIWLLVYGGLGMIVGLWVFGRRVIETIGDNLTKKITPATGFSIENGAAATVLLASKIGAPISTTHCKVGSIVFVGWVYGRLRSTDKTAKSVDWSIFRSIVLAWVVTLPAAGSLSAFMMWIFSYIY